ncbi:Phosphatidylglycerol/phosphatidylinositol transfer protein [Clonorchis sinensis]|uniref:Phosphatidylglycerol/phosphatidylinositol transfer protein n=1 Tax=Clonorchis sinensis TaxID=79923 RepID=A0A8T1MWK6_CLOSI|nr:Phosphatidylglycerol/phosphatidylinositol transfer protein [Clonorchis sinensis]
MKPFKVLVFSLILYTSSTSKPISFIDCGSDGVVVKAVNLKPCNNDPCIVYTGQPSSFVITFEAEEDIHPKYYRLYSRVAGTLGEAVLPDNDACSRITPPCPLKSGGEYEFTYNQRINWNIPKILVNSRVEIVNEQLHTFLCVEFAVQVLEGPS